MANAKREAAGIKPLRIKPSEAATMLRIHYETLRDLIGRDLFTVIAPKGRGIGKPIFLIPDEVEVYATQGEDALREHRVRKGRIKARR